MSRTIAALAVASVIAAVSVATAAEPEGALVESINGNSLDVQPMDFVPVGQIIRARMGRLC